MTQPLAAPAPDLAFAPTRAAGLDRLERFLPRAGRNYARRRDRDVAGHPDVSSLSPWLSHRAVTEAEAADRVRTRYGPQIAGKFLSELCWRTYFKGFLERRSTIWTDYRAGLGAARNRIATGAGLRREWADACAGQTGIAPFDHWAQELVRTGYLHNHARLWFASIWMHTLRLPWELGADFFLRHLLDGDAASNTLSWRWVAGLHTNGQAYAADPAAIAGLTGGRHDEATLRRQLTPPGAVVAVEGPPLPAPGPVPPDVPLPSGRIGLLLHEDDLRADHILARGLDPAGVAGFIAPARRSPLTPARRVTAFTTALAEDAVAGARGEGPVTDRPDEILAWAAGFDHIVAPHAPVGWMRDALDALPLAIHRPLRAWDAIAWPHATAGYFRFRRAIPDILDTIAEQTPA